MGVRERERLAFLLMTRFATREAAGRSEQFYPERWLEEGEENAAPKSLTFGAGPELELDSSAGEVKESFKLAMVPEGLQVKLRERVRAAAWA